MMPCTRRLECPTLPGRPRYALGGQRAKLPTRLRYSSLIQAKLSLPATLRIREEPRRRVSEIVARDRLVTKQCDISTFSAVSPTDTGSSHDTSETRVSPLHSNRCTVRPNYALKRAPPPPRRLPRAALSSLAVLRCPCRSIASMSCLSDQSADLTNGSLPPDLIFLRRLGTEEVPDEVVPAAPHHVIAVRLKPVTLIWEHQEVEVLVRLDQRIGQEHRVRWRHMVVHATMCEQQLAVQIPGVRLVRFSSVVVRGILSHQQPLVALAPVVFIIAVVMIAGFRYADVEEIAELEHRRRSGEPAAGMSPDPDLVDVDERITLRE